MNNMQLLRALGDIDDTFLNLDYEVENKKEKSNIFSKIKEEMNMKKLVPIVVLTILIACIGIYNIKNVNENREDIDNEIEQFVADININMANNISSTDMDAESRNIDEIPDSLKFINNLKIPTELELTSKCRIYIPSDKNHSIYKLHDYVFSYSLNDYSKSVTISFSQVGEVLRDCIVKSDLNKISKIGDAEFIIYQVNDAYFTTFEYKDTYFDIETKNITQDELVELLTSLIVEFRKNDIIFGEENMELIVEPIEVIETFDNNRIFDEENKDLILDPNRN